MHEPSRRAVLVGGATLLAGCSGVSPPLLGQSDESCTARSYTLDPTDWAFPAYDAANTGCAPAASAPDPDSDRSVAWRQAFAPHPSAEGRLPRAGQPVVADGRLFVAYLPSGADGVYPLSALDARTGAVDWTREFEAGQAGPTPFVVGETLYYATETAEGPAGLALDVADGATLARVDDGHRWWFAGGHALSYGTAPRRIEARSPVDWEACWEVETPEHVRSLAGDAEQVVVAMPDDGSRIRSLDPATGEPDWTEPVASRFGEPLDGIALRGDRLVVTTNSHLLVLHREDGDGLWHADIGYVHETGQTADGKPIHARVRPELGAVTENAVVVLRHDPGGLDSRIEAYSHGGDRRWTTDVQEGWWQAPVVAGETVYTFVTPSREEGAELRSYDLATGDRLSSVALDQSVYHRPIVADGRIYGVGDAVVAVE